MATLGLKEMGKFLMEGREKVLPCWLSQLSKTKLRQPTGQNFFPTFPKEFSHFLQTLAIAKYVWKMQKKSGIIKSGLDAMPHFLPEDLLKRNQPEFCRISKRFIINSKEIRKIQNPHF